MFKTYKSYSFIDKDPIIDHVRSAFDKAKALDPRLTWDLVAERSGVSKGTTRNWLQGDTKRPQAATATAVFRALGFDLAVVTPEGEVLSLTRHRLPAATSNVVKFKVMRTNVRAKADVHVKKKAEPEGERHGSESAG